MDRRNPSLTHGLLGLACVSFLLGAPAFAEDLPMDDGDMRVIQEVSPPWDAIGQVNVGGYRRRVECTGSLIAPDVVVTAAHCVINPWDRKPFPADDIHFLAGVRKSDWLGHSTAKCLHFQPGYDFADRALSKDVVLITLNDPLVKVTPLQVDPTAAQDSGLSLVHAAYPSKRRHVLTAQFGCHVVKQTHELWRTDCDARPASSGGPVFVQEEDGLKLAAIMVAADPSSSVAVPIANWADMLADRFCP
jgi:protease YdgD